jgi:hypothetical protein
MLNKFFTKPIELLIGEQKLKFCSISDFEFGLAGRTAVPSKKLLIWSNFLRTNSKEKQKPSRILKNAL